MNSSLLAPEIQERLLLLNRIAKGKDQFCLRQFQSIALELNWQKQKRLLTERSQQIQPIDYA
jgi:hypothetical protein